MNSCAMMALLSFLAETWQSVQVFVPSLPRTVCGTLVLNAMPEKPQALIVCCWK